MDLPKLLHPFFARPASHVAPDLIGRLLVRRTPTGDLRARIVETEAYLGPPDLACHASKGLTRRNRALFGAPGHAYVYFIYGMHQMLNVVTGVEGGGHAVLLRAAEPLDGWTANLTGPGNLAKGFLITPADNGLDVTGDSLFFLDSADSPRLLRTRRIGVDYAKHWRNRLLRFIDADSRTVSRPRLPM